MVCRQADCSATNQPTFSCRFLSLRPPLLCPSFDGQAPFVALSLCFRFGGLVLPLLLCVLLTMFQLTLLICRSREGERGGVSSMIDAEIKSVCKDMTTQQMHLPCRFPSPLNYSESVGDGGAGSKRSTAIGCFSSPFVIVIRQLSLFLLRMSFFSVRPSRQGEGMDQMCCRCPASQLWRQKLRG